MPTGKFLLHLGEVHKKWEHISHPERKIIKACVLILHSWRIHVNVNLPANFKNGYNEICICMTQSSFTVWLALLGIRNFFFFFFHSHGFWESGLWPGSIYTRHTFATCVYACACAADASLEVYVTTESHPVNIGVRADCVSTSEAFKPSAETTRERWMRAYPSHDGSLMHLESLKSFMWWLLVVSKIVADALLWVLT